MKKFFNNNFSKLGRFLVYHNKPHNSFGGSFENHKRRQIFLKSQQEYLIYQDNRCRMLFPKDNLQLLNKIHRKRLNDKIEQIKSMARYYNIKKK